MLKRDFLADFFDFDMLMQPGDTRTGAWQGRRSGTACEPYRLRWLEMLLICYSLKGDAKRCFNPERLLYGWL